MSEVYVEAIDNPWEMEFGFYEQLNTVTQDLWATEWSLWELAICKNCNHVISKEELFWRDKEIENTLVINLLRHNPDDRFCTNCWSDDLDFPYWLDHVFRIRRRIKWSIKTYLVVAKNEKWEIIGYEEAYIDSLERIFLQEYSYHYSMIWIEQIRDEIRRIYPDIMHDEPFIVLWTIWLLPKYRWLRNIHKVLKSFYEILPESAPPCITEIDRRNALHRMMEFAGCASLSLDKNPKYTNRIWPINPIYQTDLLISRDIKGTFQLTQKDYRSFVNMLLKWI